MSLVGNLEDLSLGDIMQIISLSQKFGVLALESEHGSGRIVFSSGLVSGACLKGVEGHYADLRSLVVGKGILDPAGFDACESRASDLGLTIEEMLRSEAALDLERIDALIKEAVEAAVLEMFTWPSGDFSFDVRSEADDADPQLILRNGINSQYLAMEGMRMRDEKARGTGDDADDTESADALVPEDMSAQELFGVDLDTGTGDAVLDDSDISMGEFVEDFAGDIEDLASTEFLRDFEDDENETTATNIVVAAVLETEDVDTQGHVEASQRKLSRVHSRPLILIDPDVAVLEWTKHMLQDKFGHVHVFQQAEQGLMRIRQYLIRGELPVVLISTDAEVDPLSGIRGLSDFVKRLKSQAAKLPVFGLVEAGGASSVTASGHFDGILERPGRPQLREQTGADPDAGEAPIAIALDALLGI